MNKLLIILVIVCSQLKALGQETDSLWGIWNDETNPDTSRLDAIGTICWILIYENPDSAYHLAQMQLDLATRTDNKKEQALACNAQGVTHTYRGNYQEAIQRFQQSISIHREIGDIKGMARNYNNIGVTFWSKGDLKNAVEYYLKSMKLHEQFGDKRGMAACLTNLGAIYDEQGNLEKAMDHEQQSLKISQEIGDQQSIAVSLSNIGGLYREHGANAKALEYENRGLKIRQEIEDKMGVSASLGNIGLCYLEMKEYDKALEHFNQSSLICSDLGNQKCLSNNYFNIGDIYNKTGNFPEGLHSCLEGLKIGEEIGALQLIKHNCQCIFESYTGMGRPKEALSYFKQYIAARDSLFNEQNIRAITQQEMQYEFDKQQLADSLEYRKQQELKDLELAEQHAKLAKEKTQKTALFGGLAAVLLFSIFIFNRFRVTNRQKLIIEAQKGAVERQTEIVEEKNREITDSITYARRIQEAILPPDKLVRAHLPESFILYKPKDIVAGDFYWIEPAPLPESTAGSVLFAAADCTGHGVPGAMVSVVCHNALNRAVREFKLTQPAQILNKTRELVIEQFDRSEESVKDGMDLALCSLNTPINQLEYAGANNPLLLIPAGATKIEDIREIKPDKQPVAKYDHLRPFTNHRISLNQGDSIYIFTDGFADQFGGRKGKKFKYQPFKELLLSIQGKSMQEQKESIAGEFEEWRGSLEQVDDVCIIGVKI